MTRLRGSTQHFAHRFEDAIMQMVIRNDDASIGAQRAPEREVEIAPVNVADATPRLADHRHTRGVIPDLLLVPLLRRKPEIDRGIAPRDGGVLALTVDAERRQPDAEAFGDARRVVLGRVGRFDGFAEARLRGIVDPGDRNRCLRAAVQGPDPGAAPLFGDEETAAASIGPVGIHRQVRAPEHAEHHFALDDQRQRDGILLAPQKALGAVDRIEGPVATGRAAAVVAGVDQVEHRIGTDARCDLGDGFDDACEQRGIPGLAQLAGVLFANEPQRREGAAERPRHDGLRAEIRDRDRRLVLLRDRLVRYQIRLDGTAQAAGLLDGRDGHFPLARIRHAAVGSRTPMGGQARARRTLANAKTLGCVALVFACTLGVANGVRAELLYATEGNNLHRIDLESLAGPDPRIERVIEHAVRGAGPEAKSDFSDPMRRDINGMVCARPDLSGGFVAGEDTGQNDTLPGWGVFDASGLQVGKLTATYFVEQGEPVGCAFAADGTLFTSELGNVGFGKPVGQLILWFPPFEQFPGPAGAYPATGASSRNFCKLTTDIGNAGSVAIDRQGRVYVASAGRGAIYRFNPPFPTGPDAAGGCGRTDETGAPLADSVDREVFYRGMQTFTGLAFAANGHLYASSVFTGEILEISADGRHLRTLLSPDGVLLPPYPTGNPMGLAVDREGSLYYADIDLVWDGLSIGPGPDGKIRRIRFAPDGKPLAPETLMDGLAYPDGLGILPGRIGAPGPDAEPPVPTE